MKRPPCSVFFCYPDGRKQRIGTCKTKKDAKAIALRLAQAKWKKEGVNTIAHTDQWFKFPDLVILADWDYERRVKPT